MIKTHNYEELTNISKRITLFAVENKLYHEIRIFDYFIEYTINEDLSGVIFMVYNENKNFYLNQILKNLDDKSIYYRNRREQNKSICDECRLLKSSKLLAHFLTDKLKLEIFCIDTNYIENIIANYILKKLYKLKN